MFCIKARFRRFRYEASCRNLIDWGVMLSPLMLRLGLPGVYEAIGHSFPSVGLIVMITMDIAWLWVILLLFYVTTRYTWRKRLSN